MSNEQKVLPKPISYDELYPGRFIKAADLRGQRTTLQIIEVIREELQDEKGVKTKGILKFRGTDKQLALNRTNGECIKGMFGHLLADWIGKRITLAPVPYDGTLPLDITHMIRIYGSPDIANDMKVNVRLPRKRPIAITMHKVEKGSAKPAQPNQASEPPKEPDSPRNSAPKYDEQTAMQALREAGDRDGIEKLYADIRKSFPVEVPLPVQALYQGLRESLE